VSDLAPPPGACDVGDWTYDDILEDDDPDAARDEGRAWFRWFMLREWRLNGVAVLQVTGYQLADGRIAGLGITNMGRPEYMTAVEACELAAALVEAADLLADKAVGL